MKPDAGEQGDIIVGWLLRLVVSFALLGLVVFDIAALVIASVDVDEAAGEVARASAVVYGATGSLPGAREAAEDVADARDVALVTFEDVGANLVVEVSRSADTLVLHRLPGTDSVVTRTGRREVEIGA